MRAFMAIVLLFLAASGAWGETKEEDAARYLETMIQSIREENEPMRNRMFMKLRVLGSVSVGPIVDALDDPSPEVRHYLAFTLGYLDDEAVIDPLFSLFRADPLVTVRCSAAEALGRQECVEAIDPLIEALADTSAQLRQSAAYALGLIGDPRARPALETAKSDSDELVRFFAEDALVEIDRAVARRKP
jgi:HEAT repeat protein